MRQTCRVLKTQQVFEWTSWRSPDLSGFKNKPDRSFEGKRIPIRWHELAAFCAIFGRSW